MRGSRDLLGTKGAHLECPPHCFAAGGSVDLWLAPTVMSQSRIKGLEGVDPFAVPLPHSEVPTRVERLSSGRRMLRGIVVASQPQF